MRHGASRGRRLRAARDAVQTRCVDGPLERVPNLDETAATLLSASDRGWARKGGQARFYRDEQTHITVAVSVCPGQGGPPVNQLTVQGNTAAAHPCTPVHLQDAQRAGHFSTGMRNNENFLMQNAATHTPSAAQRSFIIVPDDRIILQEVRSGQYQVTCPADSGPCVRELSCFQKIQNSSLAEIISRVNAGFLVLRVNFELYPRGNSQFLARRLELTLASCVSPACTAHTNGFKKGGYPPVQSAFGADTGKGREKKA